MSKAKGLWSVLPPWKLADLQPKETVLLAFSGGADSRALLHLLSELAHRDGFSVVTAHVNHGIRGEEAKRDADFCRTVAVEYGWEHLCLDADVPALAETHKRSLELEAREVRYAFFEQIMRERKIRLLVTAHHADDNLETVLFRLCRGTGLQGLCGIPPVREFANGYLVRPLLPYSRGEILDFCREEGLEFVTDSTNGQADCSRNRIRLDVIPPMEKHFAEPQKSVYRMTRSLTDDRDYLCEAAKGFWDTHSKNGGISAQALRDAHPAIRRRVIGMMLPKTLETVHLEAVETLLKAERSGASVSLPGDLCACLQGDVLAVLPVIRSKPAFEAFAFREGCFPLCDEKLTVSVKKEEKFKSTENVHNIYTSSCIIIEGVSEPAHGGLCFRPRREGDTMLHNGVRRQLRRLYRESGVPTVLRDALPLLCDGEGILWAPFVGYRDGATPAKTAGEDGQIYRVTVCVRAEIGMD